MGRAPTGRIEGTDMSKWLMRKRNGSWWLWMPNEHIPIRQYSRYPYGLTRGLV